MPPEVLLLPDDGTDGLLQVAEAFDEMGKCLRRRRDRLGLKTREPCGQRPDQIQGNEVEALCLDFADEGIEIPN